MLPENVSWNQAVRKFSRQMTGRERVTTAQEASRPALNNKDVWRAMREHVIGSRAVKPGMQLPSAETKLEDERRLYQEFGKQVRFCGRGYRNGCVNGRVCGVKRGWQGE